MEVVLNIEKNHNMIMSQIRQMYLLLGELSDLQANNPVTEQPI